MLLQLHVLVQMTPYTLLLSAELMSCQELEGGEVAQRLMRAYRVVALFPGQQGRKEASGWNPVVGAVGETGRQDREATTHSNPRRNWLDALNSYDYLDFSRNLNQFFMCLVS